MMIISENWKVDSEFQNFRMVIISGKKWLEDTLRKAAFKWLPTIYVQRDKNAMEYEAGCFLNTKEAAGRAHGFLQSPCTPPF